MWRNNMVSTNAITVTGLSKIFRDDHTTAALKDISLTVKRGEFLALLGPSGCGKSTLLRIMCTLDTPSRGRVEIEASAKDHIAFVFQQFGLLPWLTIAENVYVGLLGTTLTYREIHARTVSRLASLGLSKFANTYPHELSGGMKQRVGIARALVTNPRILFMDEPFSELDTFSAEALRKELLALWKQEKFTVVMVTHNVDEAIELADRVIVLTPRPGTIEATVPITLKHPRSLRSKTAFALHDSLTEIIKP